jgi:hypothetical protein
MRVTTSPILHHDGATWLKKGFRCSLTFSDSLVFVLVPVGFTPWSVLVGEAGVDFAMATCLIIVSFEYQLRFQIYCRHSGCRLDDDCFALVAGAVSCFFW